MVVLDPWTADPNASERTGVALTPACAGLELATSETELAGGLKATARLHRAIVRPMRNLLQDGGVVWLSEKQFWDKAKALKQSLPRRVALVPQLWKQAGAAGGDGTDAGVRIVPTTPSGAELPLIEVGSDTVSLAFLPLCLLRDESGLPPQEHAAAPEGAPQPAVARLHDGLVRISVTLRTAEGALVPLAGEDRLLGPLYSGAEAHKGVYYFNIPLPNPGDFELRAEAVHDEGKSATLCVAEPPLRYRVRVAAPMGLVAASRGVCRGCVHAGACVAADGAQLGRNAPCPRLEAAALTLQLHAPAPLPTQLFFSQRAQRPGHLTQPTRWPADLVAPAGADDQVRAAAQS